MTDYERIARVIRYIEKHHAQQPDLATLAKVAGLSPYHFHRLFSRWAGITPKSFLQCLTLAHAKRLLQQGESVLTTTLDTGLSSPSRLHDLCVTLEAASPGELKSGGACWTIKAGFADSPFGLCLIGESPRGICHFSFVNSENKSSGAALILQQWPQSRIEWDNMFARNLSRLIFNSDLDGDSAPVLRTIVRGTPFQVRIWQALLNIPKGSLVSYKQLARAAGNQNAARAAGTAAGQNPLAYLIPCHRVIRGNGMFGDYRWGATRKQVIVAWESASAIGSE